MEYIKDIWRSKAPTNTRLTVCVVYTCIVAVLIYATFKSTLFHVANDEEEETADVIAAEEQLLVFGGNGNASLTRTNRPNQDVLRLMQVNLHNHDFDSTKRSQREHNNMTFLTGISMVEDYLIKYTPTIVGLEQLTVSTIEELDDILYNVRKQTGINYHKIEAGCAPQSLYMNENTIYNDFSAIVWNTAQVSMDTHGFFALSDIPDVIDTKFAFAEWYECAVWALFTAVPTPNKGDTDANVNADANADEYDKQILMIVAAFDHTHLKWHQFDVLERFLSYFGGVDGYGYLRPPDAKPYLYLLANWQREYEYGRFWDYIMGNIEPADNDTEIEKELDTDLTPLVYQWKDMIHEWKSANGNANEMNVNFTFHAFKGLEYNNEDGKGFRDWIVTNAETAQRHRIKNAFIITDGIPGKFQSDHFPVVVDIQLK